MTARTAAPATCADCGEKLSTYRIKNSNQLGWGHAGGGTYLHVAQPVVQHNDGSGSADG